VAASAAKTSVNSALRMAWRNKHSAARRSYRLKPAMRRLHAAGGGGWWRGSAFSKARLPEQHTGRYPTPHACTPNTYRATRLPRHATRLPPRAAVAPFHFPG